MEQEQLCRRLQDLANRCDKTGRTTVSTFLTPAEQAWARQWEQRGLFPCRMEFFGGTGDCERRAAFFSPYYGEADDLHSEDQIRAVEIRAAFGTPGHRDYLGALLAMGVKREWLGDIRVSGQTAWVFCLPSVASELSGIEKVGNVSVKARIIGLSEVPNPTKSYKQVTFTVQSLRFDAVLSEIFRQSRTAAVRRIAAGEASLNYLPCLKNDTAIKEEDVLSLRGSGKAVIASIGGYSKKGRIIVHAEIFQ